MKKRVLAMALAIIIALGCVSTSVFAQDNAASALITNKYDFQVTADGEMAALVSIEEDAAHPVDSYGWDYGVADVCTVLVPKATKVLTLDFSEGGHYVYAYKKNDGNGYVVGEFYTLQKHYKIDRQPVGSVEGEGFNTLSIGDLDYSDLWLWVEDENYALEYIIAFSEAESDDALQDAVSRAAAYVYKTAESPSVGSIGGEWAVLGLARSGCDIPEAYFADYYARVEAYVKACKGVFTGGKSTDYSRIVIALTSIGKDPENVAGYDLLAPLSDFEAAVKQGINGAVWALVALDCGDYAISESSTAATQTTRQLYVDEIISRQLPDGGWSLLAGSGAQTDVSLTAMALQALSRYKTQPKVAAAIDRAVACLSLLQLPSGGFSGTEVTETESTAQVTVAVCELGISVQDSRFVKNGATMLDALMSLQMEDGGFPHSEGDEHANQMSAEQGLYALVSTLRSQQGKPSLYNMTDAISISEHENPGKGEGLPGKNENVRPMPVVTSDTGFKDTESSQYKNAIEALTARGIINGMGNGLFAPENTMTRAQFAAIITRGLGLKANITGAFADVASNAWYAGYVDTASAFGIVNGRGQGVFDPEGTISRQEAATMIARAALLCGMDTDLSAAEIRDTLAPFADYMSVADWAQGSFAFCCRENIWDSAAKSLEPQKSILRCEIAQLLYSLLISANLLGDE